MEKKTKFKLKFIQNYLLRRRISKKKPAKPAVLFPELQLVPSKPAKPPQKTENPVALYRFLNPINVHRVVGDLCFLDNALNNSEEMIGLASLYNRFKLMRDVRVSKHFLVGNYEDTLEFSSVGLLIARLKSLSNRESYELAVAIEKYAEYFRSLPFSRKPVLSENKALEWQRNFEKCLREHEDEPLLFYHFRQGKHGEILRTKIGANKILRDLTFGDDIQVFQDSLFVVPANQYFSFMKNHINICFNQENQIVKMHLNTKQGVKTISCICYNFLLGDEKVIVLTFPKELQSADLQEMYKKAVACLQSKEKNERDLLLSNKNAKNALWEKRKKLARNYVNNNIETWEKFIKCYFEPFLFNENAHEDEGSVSTTLIKEEDESNEHMSYAQLAGV